MDVTEKLFHENETKTNKLGALSLLAVSCAAAVFGMLAAFKIVATYQWTGFMLLGCCLLEVVLLICMKIMGYENSRAKYLLLTGLIFIGGVTYFIYPLVVLFLFCGPILLSVKYYNPKLTAKVSVASWLMFVLTVAMNFILDATSEPIHALHNEQAMVMWSDLSYTVLYYALPRSVCFLILAGMSCHIAKAGRRMVLDQSEVSTKATLMTAELDTAAKIQSKALATRNFVVPDGKMSICAGVRPARDVGGDFYDYFMINDHLLVLVVADVSDKGLPAAMYGVEAQSYLRFAFSEGFRKNLNGDIEYVDLEETANAVNRQLVVRNMDNMFVTMWIGCFDTRTGAGKYVNAGHNMPYLMHADGTVTSVENEPQFFMGTFDEAGLKAKSLRLRTGDRLIVYTDGIPDLQNINGQSYGEERFKAALMKIATGEGEKTPDDIRKAVVKELKTFAEGAHRYDDITFMAVGYDGDFHSQRFNLQTTASPDCAEKVMNFVNDKLSGNACPEQFRQNMDVMIDEVCTNIADYAYEGEQGPLTVDVHLGENFVSLRFIDEGPAFDPLQEADPDMESGPRIGGFGIYLVKQLADSLSYKYENGRNVLTIYKVWNLALGIQPSKMALTPSEFQTVKSLK